VKGHFWRIFAISDGDSEGTSPTAFWVNPPNLASVSASVRQPALPSKHQEDLILHRKRMAPRCN